MQSCFPRSMKFVMLRKNFELNFINADAWEILHGTIIKRSCYNIELRRNKHISFGKMAKWQPASCTESRKSFWAGQKLRTTWIERNAVSYSNWLNIFQSKPTAYKGLKIRDDVKQDGRLAPAYFSPNYKYFDQLLQMVKNKTTVLILVFKVFTSINSTTDFCTLCKKVSRFSVENFLSHSAEIFRMGTL